ncbi:MAG TPA: hypothetical protein VJ761_06880, partial [Ktedonobacteraceae bacterium]|nr:hypothetical protein [Ktedonobacteraceae bacterium]
MKKRLGKALVFIISLCLIVTLLVWSILNYQPTNNAYVSRAIYSMTFLSVMLALACRWLLLRVLRRERGSEPLAWNPLFLIDVTV